MRGNRENKEITLAMNIHENRRTAGMDDEGLIRTSNNDHRIFHSIKVITTLLHWFQHFRLSLPLGLIQSYLDCS